MPDLTQNLGLKKPLDNENADIEVINGNMDVIDSLAGEGRTTETVKKNADDISSLDLKMSELTFQGGITKVKIQSTEVNNEDGEPNGTLVIYTGA